MSIPPIRRGFVAAAAVLAALATNTLDAAKRAAAACQSITAAQALSNVLSVYFDGTPVGDQYGASKGAARMNYLQVYEKDIEFANTQPAVQAILEQASRQLLTQAR